MSNYYEEDINRSFSRPTEDSWVQFDLSSTTDHNVINSHDEKFSEDDSFEDDQKKLMLYSNSYVIKDEDISRNRLFNHISIMEDLIEDAILEVCFESHRIAKLCLTGMEHSDEKKQDFVYCFVCKENKGSANFSKHLISCFSLLEGSTDHRKAKMKANYNFKETEYDDEDFDEYDDERTERSKKGSRGKSKSQGNSNNNFPKYECMSYDEKKKFLGQKCGVVSKRSRKPCMKTLKCTAHKEDDRIALRHNLGINEENDCVDVDTIEEGVLPFYGDGSTSMLATNFHSSTFP